MGVIPPPPPIFEGSRDERREQMLHYRDTLLRMQAQQQAGPGTVVFWFLVLVGLVVWGVVTIRPYMEL